MSREIRGPIGLLQGNAPPPRRAAENPSSPRRRERPLSTQDSPSRRHRPRDIEAAPYYDDPPSPLSARKPKQQAFIQSGPTPQSPIDRNMAASPATELGRKKSLIRPERTRIDPNHPNYYYRQHAQGMNVIPSTTGHDPIEEDNGEEEDEDEDDEAENIEDVFDETESEERGKSISEGTMSADEKSHKRRRRRRRRRTLEAIDEGPRRLQRKGTKTKQLSEKEQLRRKQQATVRPPSPWSIYCAILTFWAPGAILACFGKPQKAQQRAWREKMGLISIILLIATFVGFLTFGFTQAVCGTPLPTFEVNSVGVDHMIFHGIAYNLNNMRHPGAPGIADGQNPLYNPPWNSGGQDGSFLFQNVNGACKNLITKAPGSDVPTDSDGNLAWYFPCTTFNQDGSTAPNLTVPYYLGYACHLSGPARQAFYTPSILASAGDVVFSWDHVKNSSRNLTVFSGSVLDLNLLDWFNRTEVSVPSAFDEIRSNTAVRGMDVTHAWATGTSKDIGECLAEIIKVGSVDSSTVGCIASQVVLYVSLIFILSIVGIKFILALLFQWFFSQKFAASKSSITTNRKKRAKQIEDWTEDIYRQPPKLTDATNPKSKRQSAFLPTTSRFTSPYDTEQIASRKKVAPTTMASQASNTRLLAPEPPFSHDSNDGNGSPSHRLSTTGSRSSLLMSGSGSGSGSGNRQSTLYSEGTSGPRGFISEGVVPQPPPDWEPFGYPLAHTICLVTCYSEGEDGIRTTLNSVATTEYPNSHKAILVICDGLIKGHGEDLTTPEIVLSMLGDHATLPDEVQAFSYVAVASGSKRHNMAKVYAGFYDYGENSAIPHKKQQRIPMMVLVKCGTPDESHRSKPGNRGKRDSQVILMSFLQKVMFDERMTELEYEMFNGLWKVTGISPDFYETILMVDADTKIFPDSLTHMNSAMIKDPEIMGLCGETKIANKRDSWVTMIQVFEYFISHHLSKSFESIFGGVTCLPGCFCMYRIKAPKGGQNYWVPILANPDIVEHYSENVVDTLHKKNLLLLGEDRYLSTLMLKTFPKRKQVFVPQAVCKTTVPEKFKVLLSQRRRWINSTVHNLMELVLVRDLCGTFCFSMQFVVFIELVGTLVLPAAISFTIYLIVISIVSKPVPIIPLVLLALILGLPGVLIVLTAHRWSYVLWMAIYLLSLPIWNFVLPAYSYWKFDDFSWGETRKTAGEKTKKAGLEYEGEFDSSKITMKRWGDFEKERRLRASSTNNSRSQKTSSIGYGFPSSVQSPYGPPL